MKHISLGRLDVSPIALGTMAMSGYYLDLDPLAATPSRPAPSNEQSSWVSPTSTPRPRSRIHAPDGAARASPRRVS